MNDVAGDGVGIDADTNAATFLTRAPPWNCRRCRNASWPTASSTRFSASGVRGRWSRSSTSSTEGSAQQQSIQDRVLDESIPVGAGRRQLSWSELACPVRSIPQLVKLSPSGLSSIATWGSQIFIAGRLELGQTELTFRKRRRCEAETVGGTRRARRPRSHDPPACAAAANFFGEEPAIQDTQSLFRAPQAGAAVPAESAPPHSKAIREDLGDCTRCALHKGRNTSSLAWATLPRG